MSQSPDAVVGQTSFYSRLLPLAAGVTVYLLLLSSGNALLNDPDCLWQVKVGQDILSSGRVPRIDAYTFTMAGEPWHSTQWLAQVMYALAYRIAGWSGPVVLAAAAAALTFAVLARELMRQLQPLAVLSFLLVALMLTASHLLARPHVLAMPVMVMWTALLLRASEQRRPPSLALAGLMILWANLHGGFIFGLALIGPIGLDALVNAEPQQRRALALRWAMFSIVALLCSGVTPYGFEALLASKRILDLGPALLSIKEWQPADFSRPGPFEGVMLTAFALSWWRGIRLPVVRILFVLGLLHMALSAERNQEVLALLAPLFVAMPLSRQGLGCSRVRLPLDAALVGAVVIGLGVISAVIARFDHYAPNPLNVPSAAVAQLNAINARRVLNDYGFGGYLISIGQPTFIDGRAELFGAPMLETYDRAFAHAAPAALAKLIAEYHIDAVLARTDSRVGDALVLMPGWRKIHSDPVATVYSQRSDTRSVPDSGQ